MLRVPGALSILLVFALLLGCERDGGISPSNVTARGEVFKHGGGGIIEVCLTYFGWPLSGADVSVNGRRLHEFPGGIYVVSQTSMPIEPGVVYELTVRLEHDSFSGTAVLCDSFSCLRPEQSYEHVVGQPLVAEWTSTGGDYKYVVLVEQFLFETMRETYVSPILQDTVHTIPAGAFDESGIYWMMIFSFQNGVAYHPCHALAVDRENLTRGALGFFGSARIVETRILVREPG